MIFTVVNYMPLLEEEVAHNKSPVKKSESKEGSGEPDDESDPDPESLSVIAHSYNWTERLVCDNIYRNNFLHYDYLLEGVSTPPPEK